MRSPGARTKAPREPTGPPPARTSEERRRIIAELATAEAGGIDRLARLSVQIAEARAREARAREVLAAAAEQRGALEAEQLASSSGHERRIGMLRWQLAEDAPVELAELAHDVSLLVDHARTKAQTNLAEGYQNLEGRRPLLSATNTDTLTALIDAARRFTSALEAQQVAEIPDPESLGPYAEVPIPEAQLQPATRVGDPGGLVPRALIVPVALAALWGAITGGIPRPLPILTPAESRFTEQDAARGAQRRWNSGEAWP
jgi:hypothetical protein